MLTCEKFDQTTIELNLTTTVLNLATVVLNWEFGNLNGMKFIYFYSYLTP